MIVAWIGIIRPRSIPGFRTAGPRPISFIEEGELVHLGSRDVIHGPTGVSVRLTLRIELNHDRVLAYSIENSLDELEHMGYPTQICLNSGDFALIEDSVSERINFVNGDSATKSVRVTKVQQIPPH